MPRYGLDTRVLANAPLTGLSYNITPNRWVSPPEPGRSHTIIREYSPFVKGNLQSGEKGTGYLARPLIRCLGSGVTSNPLPLFKALE